MEFIKIKGSVNDKILMKELFNQLAQNIFTTQRSSDYPHLSNDAKEIFNVRQYLYVWTIIFDDGVNKKQVQISVFETSI